MLRRSSARPRRHAAAAPLVLIGVIAASMVYPFSTRGAVALTFAPTADAYVSSAARSTNFGSATTLKFGASPSQHAYLLFNVQGSSGPIANATLLVWATAAGTAASVHGTTTAWTETGLTYNNAPRLRRHAGHRLELCRRQLAQLQRDVAGHRQRRGGLHVHLRQRDPDLDRES